MRITRRGFFATIAAAFVAKPAAGVPLALMRRYDYLMVGCPSPGSVLKFHPHAFELISGPANRLLTPKEVTQDYLEILQRNTLES